MLAQPELFRPAFQPILSLENGTVVGYEALSRFAIEPVRAPDWWFAAATRVGLGPDLQALAIRSILAATAVAGLPERVFLSVNVSPRYLAHPAIIAAVAGLDPSRLVVEITEEEPVDDYAAVRRAMAPYVERGISFAIDDAGAGFASMRHVTELRPAYVKLDADLVRGMRSRETLKAFLRALNGFTTEIGAALVAEGVERTNDLAVLTRTGFPLLAQGYAIARPGAPWPPVSENARETWMAATRQRPTNPGPVRWRRPAAARRVHRSVGEPIDNGVNIGLVLAASLRGAQIDTLETLRALGAVAAWERLRDIEPELATQRTLLALEGAIRGIRWASLTSIERQKLVAASSTARSNADDRTG